VCTRISAGHDTSRRHQVVDVRISRAKSQCIIPFAKVTPTTSQAEASAGVLTVLVHNHFTSLTEVCRFKGLGGPCCMSDRSMQAERVSGPHSLGSCQRQ
jgi:hypothetical protein